MRRAHLWLGLSAGVLLALVGLTGSALVFYPEIDRAIHASTRAVPDMRPRSWQAVDDALRQSFPERSGAWRLEVTPRGGAIPARYYPVDALGQRALKPLLVWVDPRDYAILRDTRWGSEPMTWIYDVHRRLLLDKPGATGMGLFALILVPLLLGTGVWAWWPRNGGFAKALRFRHGVQGPRRLYDVHKLAGLAGLTILPILALTGGLLNLPDVSRALLGHLSPPTSAPAPSSIPKGAPLPLDLLLERAQKAFPGAQLAWIETPGTPDGALQVTFAQPSEPSRRFPRSIIWLDRYSGAVLAMRSPQTGSGGDTVLNWLHPIHAGELIGLPGRLALFAAGLLPGTLLLTGWLRYRRRRQSAAQTR